MRSAKHQHLINTNVSSITFNTEKKEISMVRQILTMTLFKSLYSTLKAWQSPTKEFLIRSNPPEQTQHYFGINFCLFALEHAIFQLLQNNFRVEWRC